MKRNLPKDSRVLKARTASIAIIGGTTQGLVIIAATILQKVPAVKPLQKKKARREKESPHAEKDRIQRAEDHDDTFDLKAGPDRRFQFTASLPHHDRA